MQNSDRQVTDSPGSPGASVGHLTGWPLCWPSRGTKRVRVSLCGTPLGGVVGVAGSPFREAQGNNGKP